MNSIKKLLFDMDGVLFDTEGAYLNIWTKVFNEYGYEQRYLHISNGNRRKNLKKPFLDVFGQDLPINEMYKEKDNKLLDVIRKGQVPLKENVSFHWRNINE